MPLDEMVERLRSPMFDKAGELGHAAHEAADRIAAMREALEGARNIVSWRGGEGSERILQMIDNALTGKEAHHPANREK